MVNNLVLERGFFSFLCSFYLLSICSHTFLELALFSVSIVVMFKTGDLRKIAKDRYKIALLLPFGAVLRPMLAAGSGSEYALPLLLVIPSLFYLAIFAYSMSVGRLRADVG